MPTGSPGRSGAAAAAVLTAAPRRLLIRGRERQRLPQLAIDVRIEAAQHHGRADRPEAGREIREHGRALDPKVGGQAADRVCREARHPRERREDGVRRGRPLQREAAGLPRPRRSTAPVISPIGVMPAIGSCGKLPSEYDTAPTSLPSMYTGLPLIPAMTPVVASGPPSSLARIRSRRGPMTLCRTPMMWALNSSIVDAGEHGAADADHARPDVGQREEGRGLRCPGDQDARQSTRERGSEERSSCAQESLWHRYIRIYRRGGPSSGAASEASV